MMTRIKQLTSESPAKFALAVTLATILMLILSTVLANRWPAESSGWYLANTMGRVVSIAILIAVLGRLGWLRAAGLTQPGRWQAWLTALLALAYMVAASTFAMSGRLDFPFASPLPAVVALFLLTHVFLEEVAFRGLVLVAFTRAMGSSRRGVIRSVLLSALFFAGMHLINLLGGYLLAVVLLQSAGAIFQGVLYGALLLNGRSIYPVIFLHGLANVAVFLVFDINPSAASMPTAWLVQTVLLALLAILGLVSLRGRQSPTLDPVWRLQNER